jgi:hypothetical protein
VHVVVRVQGALYELAPEAAPLPRASPSGDELITRLALCTMLSHLPYSGRRLDFETRIIRYRKMKKHGTIDMKRLALTVGGRHRHH